MWFRVAGKLLALVGLYALVLAGLGMRFSGERNASDFNVTIGELAIVTAVFIAVGVFVIARRPRQPLD